MLLQPICVYLQCGKYLIIRNMKIIKPSFEIIDQQAGIDGLLKHLESAGGTCGKSEDGNTASSPKEFAERMIIQVSEVNNSAIKSPKLGLAPVLIAGLR